MFIGLAIGVGTTRHIITRVHTIAVNASQVIFAIVIGRAFGFGYRPRTTACVWISDRAFRAFAYVTASGIYAISSVTARIIYTFVDIDATVLRITLVTGQTHTSRWIARSAFGIDTTRESIARIYIDKTFVIFHLFAHVLTIIRQSNHTFTKIPIERVCIKWRWTNALSRLYTFFIGFAFMISDTPFLGGRTQTMIRIPTVTMRASALMGTR